MNRLRGKGSSKSSQKCSAKKPPLPKKAKEDGKVNFVGFLSFKGEKGKDDGQRRGKNGYDPR